MLVIILKACLSSHLLANWWPLSCTLEIFLDYGLYVWTNIKDLSGEVGFVRASLTKRVPLPVVVVIVLLGEFFLEPLFDSHFDLFVPM
jgi:hypothetical protein